MLITRNSLDEDFYTEEQKKTAQMAVQSWSKCLFLEGIGIILIIRYQCVS